jgi:hypothetical protein
MELERIVNVNNPFRGNCWSRSLTCASAPRGGPVSELFPITEHRIGTPSGTKPPKELSVVPSLGCPSDRQLLERLSFDGECPDRTRSCPPPMTGLGDLVCQGFSSRLNTCWAFCSRFTVPGGQKLVDFCRNSVPNRPILNTIGHSVHERVVRGFSCMSTGANGRVATSRF